ncbi:hypothetical protein POM88_045777 [Heracleum sosnowskyi]|uniref:Protein kinase domain-containing protein n=1 Tax=Heracleum sosnowskyi TaxID=360622 RepID=A0AAD8H7X3_9APIA|nr:hypothetical protein POM88_045777 [Heracleum sosnowskyi]
MFALHFVVVSGIGFNVIVDIGDLSTKSDVFCYGVVSLEILTGRRAMDKSRPSRDKNLTDWAKPFLRDPKKLDRIMDPTLEGQYSKKGAKKAAAVAYQCLSHNCKSVAYQS